MDTRYVPLLMALGNIIGAILFWTLHSWEGFQQAESLANDNSNRSYLWLHLIVGLPLPVQVF